VFLLVLPSQALRLQALVVHLQSIGVYIRRPVCREAGLLVVQQQKQYVKHQFSSITNSNYSFDGFRCFQLSDNGMHDRPALTKPAVETICIANY
jgi:hypothetical protein